MKRDVYTVPVRISVPAGTHSSVVQGMLDEMIGEALHACDGYAESGESAECTDLAESIDRIKSSDFNTRAAEYECSEGTDLDCSVDVNAATYVGDSEDGVYFQVFEDGDGQFWLSAIVDSDTGSFVDTLVDTEGPYESEDAAALAGQDAAIEWCAFNDVSWDDDCDD